LAFLAEAQKLLDLAGTVVASACLGVVQTPCCLRQEGLGAVVGQGAGLVGLDAAAVGSAVAAAEVGGLEEGAGPSSWVAVDHGTFVGEDVAVGADSLEAEVVVVG